METLPTHECRIAVGEVVLSLACPTAAYAASMREYFVTGVTAAPPDVRLRLELIEDTPQRPVPNSLVATKRLADGGFAIADDLVTGAYDAAGGEGWLRVQWYLTKAQLTRVFEQILYQAFYSARARRGYDAMLLHASAVIRDGDGFLFVGASGRGKSTVADLSRSCTVLNDEVALVEFTPAGPELRSTPFNGLYRDKHAGQAPLRAVFLLAHGRDHHLEAVSAGAAVAEITAQVIAPVALEDTLNPRTSQLMLDAASHLVGAAPVRRLVFTPDAGFWQAIDGAFPPAGGLS